MKQKKLKVAKRNHMVVLAITKTGAGRHGKSNKALRKLTKQLDIKSSICYNIHIH